MELFLETIEAIKKQYEHDAKCTDAFRVLLPNDYISGYETHYAVNQLVKLLQVSTNDNHKDSWIEYYLWELDFGSKYEDGCARDINSNNIILITPTDLWNLISDENK